MSLDHEQVIRLLMAANRLRDAQAVLKEAASYVPVVGDAELHTMTLDLARLSNSIVTHADNAQAIAREATRERN